VAVRKLDDLVAFQLAADFKRRVYQLVREHPAAQRDFRYCGQLFDAASSVEANIAEGWRRFVAREMCQFLRYSLASLEEAKRRVIDGIHRGYFTDEDCRDVLTLGDRCGAATMALWHSLQPFAGRP
jgi:four helix bundle protein